MRIIEASLDVHGANGTSLGDSSRLITTLPGWRRCPAGELIRRCHERREIEVACLALRHTLLGGYVLRSRDRAGAEQELWALLAACQAPRMAMTAAAGTVPGTDPDRASFTAALETAREQVTSGRGIAIPADPGDTGRIGRAVLAGLLPARRARYSARKVKCSTSRYHLRDQDRPELPATITRVQVTVFAPPPDRPAALPRSPRDPFAPRQPGPKPEETGSPGSWPASPDATGPDTTSRPCSASSPATCSPSSANGPAGASSPRPEKAGTPSPNNPGRSQHRQARNPNETATS